MKAITLGDVFCVEIAPQSRKFFQYVGNDVTQLNSSVIRAFKTSILATRKLT